ncbi:MAG: hypothetical protein M1587_08370 [Thaumarchaeota archaeon]|nr:hypothetical protein [Nitrososphaerota archaeon]
MPEIEDSTSTFISLLGGISGYLVDSKEVILLSLSLAAALKALPSLHKGTRVENGERSKTPRLINAEDWIFFGASLIGYLLTAGTGNLDYAIVGLLIAAICKSTFSFIEYYGEKQKHGSDKYSPSEDFLLLTVALIPAVASYFTSNLDYALYGLVFAFIAKGSGSMG